MGLIDTLSAGFDRVTKRLWLILLPALVDVAIWIGPRISVSSLSQEAMSMLPTAPDLGAQYEQSLELAGEWLVNVGAHANLLSLLSMRILGLPSLIASFAPGEGLQVIGQRVLQVRTWPSLLGWVVFLTALSLLLGCFCLSWIAQEARDEELDVAYALQVTGRSWLRLMALVLFAAVAVTTVSLGAGVSFSVVSLFSVQLGALFFSALVLVGLWLSAYLGIISVFVPRVTVFDDMGIWHSLRSSVNVVHRNLIPAILFVVLISVLQTGLMYIWRLLAVNTAGALVGILGNSYVSTGLVMASLIFYRDRFVAWQDATPPSEAGERQP